jgi:hypothetical protein
VLTWGGTNATRWDLKFGTDNPPTLVSRGFTTPSRPLSSLTLGTTYYWQIIAHNDAGATTGPVWSFTTTPPSQSTVVIYASDIRPTDRHGSWTAADDPAAAGGVKLVTADNGVANLNAPLASPTDYVDVDFNADAGVPHTIWLRMQALNNSKYNDAVWVQFSDARAGGAPVYSMFSTSGLLVNLATDSGASSLNTWGWQNTAYWLTQATQITFATSGWHRMRIQVREDGVQFDQIVLSPTTYATSPPGPVGGDHTIVPK